MAAPIYVLGGYQTDFSRNWTKENKHVVAMMREAVMGGIEATALDPKEVETIHVGNFAAELYSMQGHLGARLHWTPVKESDWEALRTAALGPAPEPVSNAIAVPITLGLRLSV